MTDHEFLFSSFLSLHTKGLRPKMANIEAGRFLKIDFKSSLQAGGATEIVVHAFYCIDSGEEEGSLCPSSHFFICPGKSTFPRVIFVNAYDNVAS